jgi:hypothetical protein
MKHYVVDRDGWYVVSKPDGEPPPKDAVANKDGYDTYDEAMRIAHLPPKKITDTNRPSPRLVRRQ